MKFKTSIASPDGCSEILVTVVADAEPHRAVYDSDHHLIEPAGWTVDLHRVVDDTGNERLGDLNEAERIALGSQCIEFAQGRLEADRELREIVADCGGSVGPFECRDGRRVQR